MKFEELIVLLPCHSLEDFPVHYEGPDAAGLLATWSALWHPALLASAGRVPGWVRADGPPDALTGRLILIPGAERVAITGRLDCSGQERRGLRDPQAARPGSHRGGRSGRTRRRRSGR